MFQETIFTQIIKLIDHKELNRCIERYDGNKYIKDFSCYDQFLCMLFGQLANKKSLRSIVFSLNKMKHKLYHMGFRCKNISLNNLSNANGKRNWEMFYDYAQSLIIKAKKLYIDENFDLEVVNNIYAFDSTTIALCLSVFNWANFRSTKAGIKLHTLLNIKSNISESINITNAIVSDVKELDNLIFETNAIYVIDRAYLDFSRLERINKEKAFFIIRQKTNISLQRVYSRIVDKNTGLKYDQTIKLCSKKVQKFIQKSLDE